MMSSSDLTKMIIDSLSDGYDDEELREEAGRELYNEISQLPGSSVIRTVIRRLCERIEDLEGEETMAKLFKVTYIETFKKSYVIEAESQEEAEEKANILAEQCEIPIDNADDFDHWDLEVGKETTEDEAIYYDRLETEE